MSETLFLGIFLASCVAYSIPVASPWIDKDDISSVTKALRETRISMGPYVEEFEKNFAKSCKCKYAVATSNGTAALHLALAAIRIKPGDEVLIPSFSYVATANCVQYQNAKPVFVEIEPETFTVEPLDIERKITRNTRAIIVVHYGGQCANMGPILDIARRNGLKVIEDATEAHGAKFRGKFAGSLGDLACFSFTANKNMTTGEGGMVTTNDPLLERRVRLLRSHGQTERYRHSELGYNYRFTDLLAALGIAQLKKLPRVISKKIRLGNRYTRLINEELRGYVQPPTVARGRTHTYVFYTVKFRSREMRDHTVRIFERKGIESRIAFPPIHQQPQYRGQYRSMKLPVTERISDLVLSLPIFAQMSSQTQDKVIQALREALSPRR